jgi:hypothetical protein
VSNLYEISLELHILVKALEAAEGEITPELEDALNRLEMEAGGKIRALRNIVKNEESRLEAIKQETDRLKSLKKATENKIEWLKAYLVSCIEKLGGFYDGGTFKLGIGESLSVDADIEKLPEIYKRTKIIVEPDKEAIKEQLKIPGSLIPGATLVHKFFLRMT